MSSFRPMTKLITAILLLCCAAFAQDFQKVKIIEIANSTIAGSTQLVNNPNQSAPPIAINHSWRVVLVTVAIGDIRYTGQFFQRSLYGKNGFKKDDLVLGAEVEAAIKTNVKVGNWMHHSLEDELALRTSSGATASGEIVRKALDK